MRLTQKYLDELTYQIIGCAIEVHKQLGPGLIESVYAKCYNRELSLRNIDFQNQLWVPIEYKEMSLEADLRLDVLVEDLILVELKSVEGILINFNCTNIFKEGQKTFVNEYYAALPKQ